MASNSAATQIGDSNNGNPFNITGSSFIPSDTQRYQQVDTPSQFTALATGGEYITQISFRPDDQYGAPFSSISPDIRIDLSTTTKSESNLSTVFGNNVGANDKIVFGGATGSPLKLSSADSVLPNGTTAFDIIVNLTTPFFYNPIQGSLLLDVRNFNGVRCCQFDSATDTGDGTASIFTDGGGVNATSADFTSTTGLVTQFTFATSVPEPSLTALPASLATLLLKRRSRHHRCAVRRGERDTKLP